jgi:hypothetical protein
VGRAELLAHFMREFHAVCGRTLAGFFEAMLIQILVWSTASPMPASASSSQLRATVSASLETSRVNLLIRLPVTYAKAAGYRTANASPFATLLNFIFVVILCILLGQLLSGVTQK